MTNIYFVRHAEPDFNVKCDRTRPLTKKGEQDTAKVLEFFKDKNIDLLLSSPYKRAIDTIKPFANYLKKDIELIEDFRERKIDSCWIDDFEKFSINQWKDFDYKLSDGESLKEVQTRNIKELNNVLNKYSNKNIIIGSHGTAISTIINFYDNSFNYENFKKIRNIMPLVVKFSFNDKNLKSIEFYNI
ncbi:histidine phosphatase family protein [uncultured Tyzzerella sp.]|uniref:histidine phosphatase family protein n=1 Tax=uncultured Tyzzerella sp. TaxID=2321398 RepID=UPI002943F12E|nr:histidine phosphatase family protein [uncultured Tyzzerella sp.]